MRIKIQIDETELKKLVREAIRQRTGDAPVPLEHIKIETKSKQNYRSEWESGAGFRATYEADI